MSENTFFRLLLRTSASDGSRSGSLAQACELVGARCRLRRLPLGEGSRLSAITTMHHYNCPSDYTNVYPNHFACECAFRIWVKRSCQPERSLTIFVHRMSYFPPRQQLIFSVSEKIDCRSKRKKGKTKFRARFVLFCRYLQIVHVIFLRLCEFNSSKRAAAKGKTLAESRQSATSGIARNSNGSGISQFALRREHFRIPREIALSGGPHDLRASAASTRFARVRRRRSSVCGVIARIHRAIEIS